MLVFQLIAAVLVSAVAALVDARSGRIPNTLTLPTAAAGLVLNAVLGGAQGALTSLAGLVVAGLVPFALHRATQGIAIGGGDVKLFAALGALVGPSTGLELEFSAFVALSLYAMIRLAFHGRLLAMLANVVRLALRPFVPIARRRPLDSEAMTELRMGPAIFAGVATVGLAEVAVSWAPWLA